MNTEKTLTERGNNYYFNQGFEAGQKRYKHRLGVWLFRYDATSNPHQNKTGSGKKHKAAWHNGLLAGRKSLREGES